MNHITAFVDEKCEQMNKPVNPVVTHAPIAVTG